MTNVGWASLSVIPSFDGFQGKLERGTAPGLLAAGRTGGVRFGDAAGRSAGQRFGSVFRTAAKATLIGVAGAGALAVKFGSDAIGSASDLNESLNAVNVTYGKQAGAVKKLGRESAKSLGLSNNEFNSLSVRFSAFTKTIAGGNGKKVVRTLDDLSTRASDFASVMNLDVNEAAGLFQSGLAGESEPLRRFGIDLSAASVEAFAYANGIAESGSKLTEAQKVQARYGSIMAQTNKTQGDFKNTSNQLANEQRILSARWEDGKAKLGKGLLPIMTDAADFLLDEGIPAFEDFSDWFTKKGVPAFEDFVDQAKPVANKWLPKIGDGFKTAAGFAKDAAGFAGDLVSAFDEMPGWVKKILVGGVAGGLTAKKLGLGKLVGGSGLLSKGGSPLNPLNVFVVNEGFGGGGVGGKGKGVGGKVAGAAGKGLGLGPQVAIGAAGVIASAYAVRQSGKLLAEGFNQWVMFGDRGRPGGAATGATLPHPDSRSFKEIFGTTKDLNAELDRTHSKFLRTKRDVEEFGGAIRERIPRTIPFDMPGLRKSEQDARDLLAALLELRGVHMDTRLDRAGANPTTRTGGGKGGGGVRTTDRATIIQSVNNTYHVQDLREAERRDLDKRRTISRGGFG